MLHMVQLVHGSGTALRLLDKASVGYPSTREHSLDNPSELKSCLDGIFRAHKFSGRDVVTAMPSEDIKVMSVTYESKSNHPDSEAIVQIVRDRVAGDLENYVLDYLPVRSKGTDGNNIALVAIAKREDVIGFLDNL